MEKHQGYEIGAPKYDTFITETSMLENIFSISYKPITSSLGCRFPSIQQIQITSFSLLATSVVSSAIEAYVPFLMQFTCSLIMEFPMIYK